MRQPVLLELQYLPPVQYFTKLVDCPALWIEQCEHYQKGSYRNRCHIAGPNGLHRLSIPLVKGKNEQLPIREVRIAHAQPWPKRHWQSIRTAYGNSPFFFHYADQLRPLFEKKFDFLFDFNLALLRKLLALMELDVPLQLTAEYHAPAPAGVCDWRGGIFPKKHRQKEDPAFRPSPYPQVFAEKHGFLPNLSILDLLFCTGPQASMILAASIFDPKSKPT